VSKYKDHHFTTYTAADGMASNTVFSMAEGTDGTMWFATPSGLSALSNGQWHTYTTGQGLPSNNVNCVLSSPVGIVWVGTASGLGWIQDGRILTSARDNPVLQEQIFGMAEDKQRQLWIATSNHVLSLKPDDLLRGTFRPEDLREYGLEDGLVGSEGVKRHPSVFAHA